MSAPRRTACILLAAALATPAFAQSEKERRDGLVSIYRVMISNEHCDFEMSEKEAEAVSEAAENLVKTLRLSEEQANKLYVQAEIEMEKQGWDSLCDPKGDWARNYRKVVQTFSQPSGPLRPR